MGATKGILVDHIDHDVFNNVRSNLRLCTPAENSRNKIVTTGSNRYKGVRKSGNKFAANIGHNGKVIYIGLFDTEVDAAEKYNIAAIKYHGEFACINEI